MSQVKTQQVEVEREAQPPERAVAPAPARERAGGAPPVATPAPAVAGRQALAIEKRLISRLLASLGSPPFRVRLWDGQLIAVPDSDPVAVVHIRDRGTLYRLLRSPEVQFGEAYSEGRIAVEGDLVAFLEAVYRAAPPRLGWLQRLPGWIRGQRSNTRAGSRHNIHHHYDIGNDFYKLWLDEQLLYTCAYFPEPAMSLEAAQVAKMDHVCRKLRLRPGDRVAEAGCGWGALARHMAVHYGAKVRAFNISREQVAYAKERAKAEGLADRVEYIEDDYRTIADGGGAGAYDAFVSVGMLEHVGPDHYHELGRVIDRCLTRTGRGLIHTIGRHRPIGLSRWIEKRIFPGACPPTLRQMMDLFEPFDLAVLDVENLRLHYALTLRHWLERFERSRERVAAMFDERFVRAWRLYLAGSEVAFTTSTMQLFQVVFNRHDANDPPWSRAHLYESVEAGKS